VLYASAGVNMPSRPLTKELAQLIYLNRLRRALLNQFPNSAISARLQAERWLGKSPKEALALLSAIERLLDGPQDSEQWDLLIQFWVRLLVYFRRQPFIWSDSRTTRLMHLVSHGRKAIKGRKFRSEGKIDETQQWTNDVRRIAVQISKRDPNLSTSAIAREIIDHHTRSFKNPERPFPQFQRLRKVIAGIGKSKPRRAPVSDPSKV
jgi:hypothetical protein